MSSNPTNQQRLDDLFTAPTLPPSRLAPQRVAGADIASLAALQDVLKDNHERHHIFFNDMQFHNHITHRALAIYALGGTGTVIRDYYKRDSDIQRPAFESPEPITEVNFVDHLGDENYYRGYVSFFSKKISEKGAASTLEEFIFSEKYNFQDGRDPKTQPEMLSRFSAGLVHPLIHSGYGVEFGIKGMLVEGLALAAVHKIRFPGALPPSFFVPNPARAMDSITAHLSSLALETPSSTNVPTVSKAGGVHVFDVIARILKDDNLRHEALADARDDFEATLGRCAAKIRGYAEKWTIDQSQPNEIERKMEEVVWLSSLLYGAGGITPTGFQSDFFFMHMVTSSLFLPSLLAYLSPRSQVLLLRGYLFIVLVWWVYRGRPAPNIKGFVKISVAPSVVTKPAPDNALTTETITTPNPFLPILQSAIPHPNDHLIKIQRTFAHYNTLYGTRPPGYFKGTELEDAELLDGSFFVKAALLTADYVGWVREGEEARAFSTDGFYA